jgi:hypothetical protein
MLAIEADPPFGAPTAQIRVRLVEPVVDAAQIGWLLTEFLLVLQEPAVVLIPLLMAADDGPYLQYFLVEHGVHPQPLLIHLHRLVRSHVFG